MYQDSKLLNSYSWIFFSTGVFAVVGAIYTWGEGPLYLQDDLLTALVPWADLVLTGPLSILAAYGLAARKNWGVITGLLVCGIYLLGSTLIYITLIWEGLPYPLQLAIPPLAGIAIGISFPLYALRNQAEFIYLNNRETPEYREKSIPVEYHTGLTIAESLEVE